MKKVEEKKDTSREILAINIDSEIFSSLRMDLDREIRRCIRDVLNESFEAGEITVKLNIEIPRDYERYPSKDPDTGEDLVQTYEYRKPLFEHKITTVLKQQFKTDGCYSAKRDVQFIDGEFVAVPVLTAQVHMDDLAERLAEVGATVK